MSGGSVIRDLGKAWEAQRPWEKRASFSFYLLRMFSCIYARVGEIKLRKDNLTGNS